MASYTKMSAHRMCRRPGTQLNFVFFLSLQPDDAAGRVLTHPLLGDLLLHRDAARQGGMLEPHQGLTSSGQKSVRVGRCCAVGRCTTASPRLKAESERPPTSWRVVNRSSSHTDDLPRRHRSRNSFVACSESETRQLCTCMILSESFSSSSSANLLSNMTSGELT